MLVFKTLTLCLFYLQLIQSHTPAGLRALAVLHHQRAKAIAKALNLRAQAQYNAAIARARTSSLGQFDHRLVRDSNRDFPLGQQQLDPHADAEDAIFYDPNDLGDAFEQFSAPTHHNQQTTHGKRESVGMGDNLEAVERTLSEEYDVDTNPKHSCIVQQFGDMPQLDEDDQRVATSSEESARLHHDDYRVRKNVLMGNMEANEDNEEIGDCKNCPTLLSFMPDQSAFLRQGFSESGDDMDINQRYSGSVDTSRPLQNQYFDPDFEASKSEKSADPYLQPHGFIYTHTHSNFHGVQPLQPNIQTPTSQLVTPEVSFNVIQNQNAPVLPRFATATIQPGLNPAIANYLPVIPSTRPDYSKGFGVNIHGRRTGQAGHQTVPAVVPNVAGNTFRETQIINQGAREPQLMKVGMIEEPLMQYTTRLFSSSENSASNEERGAEDEKQILRAFFHMKAPEYDDYSDRSHPQNRKDIVRYIEDENSRIKIMLPIMKENTRYNQDKIYPHNIIIENNYENFQPSNDVDSYEDIRLKETNFADENKQGTIFMDNAHMDPLPTLPEHFNEMDPEQRRQSVMNILETEQRNIQNILQQIDENRQRNLNEFDRLIDVDGDHRDLRHREHFQNYDQTDRQEAREVDISEEPYSPDIRFQRMRLDQPLAHRISHYSTNFHNSQYPQLQTVAQDKLGSPKELDQSVWEEVPEIASKYTENDPEGGIQPTGGSTLGYLFQIPDRRFSDDYLRLVRSLNQTTMAKFDELLQKEKELINSLKKNAKHDQDLMMIGYIGDSLIDDLGKKMNKTKRTKREIESKNLPINRLFTDPKTNLNVPKTLENLGAATRTVFEHKKAPLYHVRNMVGSAQDVVLATMKIPTNNFLIPSTYEILNTKSQDNHQVGTINPSLFARTDEPSSPEKERHDEVRDTFNRVGSAVRGSVLSGREVLGHVGEMANHAKNAFYTSRYAMPRLILKQIPTITREPRKQALIITPRIFDVSEDDGGESSPLGKPQDDFIKLGHILHAVGVSNPDRNVKLERIIIEPRSSFLDPELLHIVKSPKFLNTFKDILGRIRVENVENDDQDVIGNALNVLRDARATMGVNSLRDFIVKMKRELETVFKNDMLDNRTKEKNMQQIKELHHQTLSENKLTPHTLLPQQSPMKSHLAKELDEIPQPQNIEESNSASKHVETAENTHSSINRRMAKTLVAPDQDKVGASFFPQEILHPFMGQISELQMQQFKRGNNGNEESRLPDMDQIENDRNLGQILGTINPMMFERIFNETLKMKNIKDTPYSMFHHHHDGRSHGHHQVDDDTNLETSMAIKGRILKPFMGYGSTKTNPELKEKRRIEAEDALHYTEFENLPETPEWIEILHPLLETDSDYDE